MRDAELSLAIRAISKAKRHAVAGDTQAVAAAISKLRSESALPSKQLEALLREAGFDRQYYSLAELGPYFEQEQPIVPITGLIAELGLSRPSGVAAAAVCKVGRQYLVVEVSGDYDWPYAGITKQQIRNTRQQVRESLSPEFAGLFERCGTANWGVTKPLREPAGGSDE